MNPSSIDTLKNNFFEIQNVNSSFNQYYHLTAYSAKTEHSLRMSGALFR